MCSKCVNFFVTHDKNRPWGCRKFNFKSKALPNQTVSMTTGTECAYFKDKSNTILSKRVR
jgi:hypothetical protein